MGITEAAQLLGVSRQRIDQLASDSRADFPEPVAVITNGLAKARRWHRDDVIAWGRATGRLPTEDA